MFFIPFIEHYLNKINRFYTKKEVFVAHNCSDREVSSDNRSDYKLLTSTWNVTLVPIMAEKYCPAFLQIIYCLTPGVEMFQRCFDRDDQQKMINGFLPLTKDVIGFLCNDGGKNIVGKDS